VGEVGYYEISVFPNFFDKNGNTVHSSFSFGVESVLICGEPPAT